MSEVCQELSWNRRFSDTSLKIFSQCFESPFFPPPFSPAPGPGRKQHSRSTQPHGVSCSASCRCSASRAFVFVSLLDALELLSAAFLGVLVILGGSEMPGTVGTRWISSFRPDPEREGTRKSTNKPRNSSVSWWDSGQGPALAWLVWRQQAQENTSEFLTVNHSPNIGVLEPGVRAEDALSH